MDEPARYDMPAGHGDDFHEQYDGLKIHFEFPDEKYSKFVHLLKPEPEKRK